jgi:glycosyltransferase involved in cell wall biosynthesis
MSKPRVTIITACRNGANTIKDAIDSIIAQGYENLEYIIVDADSDDGTAEIIEKYKQHVSIWIREPDKGIVDAWNKGIRQASGDIVGILNTDDYYLPDAMQRAVDTFVEDEECGFVFGHLRVVNEETGDEHIEMGLPDYHVSIVYDVVAVPHPTVFVRKKVYEQIGVFDSAYTLAMDYEFVRRMVHAGIKGICIPHLQAVMRQGGVSDRNIIEAFRQVMRISIRYGFNPFLAVGYFSLKAVRTWLGRFLSLLGISVSMRRRIRTFIKTPLQIGTAKK